mmetsp:Transcript_13720/g.18873  ORF Transcript_13720/g.18873 Transcript_13720/m.18873 type:complete len:445 (-) Transcript_13720:120-1454(-)
MKVPTAVNEKPYTPSAVRTFVLTSFRWLMINLGRFLALFGWRPWSSFDEAQMKKEASAATEGLTDYGDEKLRPVLSHVLTSLRNDKDLTMFGRWFLHHHWIENVFQQRLRIQRDLKKFPEIENVPIRRPLFIIGNPRSGTTIFHYLLSMDPKGYAPPLWQATFPCPPPSHDPNVVEKRIDNVRDEMGLYFDIAPLLRSLHPVDIHLPHECYHFFDRTYLDSQWHLRCQGEKSYFEYYENLRSEDVVPHYEDYKTQMKLLALNHPGFKSEKPIHFIMKDPNPTHDYFPEALLKTFPDANIIEMHRHPADSLRSYFLLESEVAKLFYTKTYDLVSYGKRLIQTFLTRRERIDSFKDQFLKDGNGDRYLDVRYKDYMEDPIAMVKQVYDYFGYEYTQEFEDRMKWFLENNTQFKFGNYQHLLAYEPYGYTREDLEKIFGNYIKQYNL